MTTRLIVSFNVGQIGKLSADDFARLRRAVDGLPEDQAKAEEAWYRDYDADIVEVTRLVGSVTVRGEVSNTVANLIVSLSAKIDMLTNKPAVESYNERVNVHVPGLGLLLLDDVYLANDCCTDELQKMLDQGWRIIAACPQPDQRRPDYILGRKRP